MADTINLGALALCAPGEEVPSPRLPWPHHGESFRVVLHVEYIGLFYEDEPQYMILSCPTPGAFEKLTNTIMDVPLWELVYENERIHASGVFEVTLTYQEDIDTDWEAGFVDVDYGYNISDIKYLRPANV